MNEMRDYKKAWVDDMGKQYRQDFYERSQFSVTLINNPAITELLTDLSAHNPKSILEVGCGFGRLLQPVAEHFNEIPVVGCDISPDMLSLCPEELDVFEHNILDPIFPTKYDVVFCRGVFMYFTRKQRQLVMQNLVNCTTKAILVYEWSYIIEEMKKSLPHDLFKYSIIEQIGGE